MEPVDEPSEPDSFGETGFVDIGVGSSPPQGKRRGQRQARPADANDASKGGRSPSGLIAIAIAVVAAIALAGTLFGGGQEQARDVPRPAPTSPPEVLTPFPDPVRPSPTPTVQVPVVSQGLSRAGEECRIPLGDDYHLSEVVFTIPDGRTIRECANAGPLLRDPRAVSEEALGDVFVTSNPFGASLNSFRVQYGWPSGSATWEPVNGRRAYRLERETSALNEVDRMHLIEVPGGTVFVHQRNRDFAPGIEESIDALVASVRVEGPDGLPTRLPVPGGWCAGDNYVTKVPDDWFAGDSCRWLNSSSESPVVLQCECLPPLWVEHVSLPFDGDFGFSQIDNDQIVEREGASPVRVIEGLRRDPNNMDRPLRAVIVDGGVRRVVVLATEFPEHVLPGHTWQDTLIAQQFLVDNLRFHSLPECGAGARLIAIEPDGPFVAIDLGADTLGLPSGSAVRATGCERQGFRTGQAEVRVEARPSVVGWIDVDRLAPPEIELCTSAERGFDPGGWDQTFDGDFDGDGRSDQGFVRAPGQGDGGGVVTHEQLPYIAVLFANGGLATGVATEVGVATTERFIGMGRDAIGVTSTNGSDVAWRLYEVADCAIEQIFEGVHSTGAVERSGFCRAQSGLSEWLRSWQAVRDEHQGWVTALDRRWGPTLSFSASDRALSARADAKVCGPVLAGPLAPVSPNARNASLAGEHQLTLQWLAARARTVGGIRFEPLGAGRYEVTGSHVTEFGEVVLIGVIEVVGDDELAYQGRIESRVPWLNAGEPCVRNAGQRFVRRPATNTFRMQDRINCDGARTDWIDITIVLDLFGDT